MDDEILNQSPPLTGYNLFATDRVLREAVAREGAGWACAELEEYGRKAGSAETIEWGVLANEYPPVFSAATRRLSNRFLPAAAPAFRFPANNGRFETAVSRRS